MRTTTATRSPCANGFAGTKLAPRPRGVGAQPAAVRPARRPAARTDRIRPGRTPRMLIWVCRRGVGRARRGRDGQSTAGDAASGRRRSPQRHGDGCRGQRGTSVPISGQLRHPYWRVLQQLLERASTTIWTWRSPKPAAEIPPRGRRLTPDARREQILVAARKLFSERPFTSVTTADVAEAAGVARSLVHHYFGGIRELFLAVVAQGGAALVDVRCGRARSSRSRSACPQRHRRPRRGRRTTARPGSPSWATARARRRRPQRAGSGRHRAQHRAHARRDSRRDRGHPDRPLRAALLQRLRHRGHARVAARASARARRPSACSSPASASSSSRRFRRSRTDTVDFAASRSSSGRRRTPNRKVNSCWGARATTRTTSTTAAR